MVVILFNSQCSWENLPPSVCADYDFPLWLVIIEEFEEGGAEEEEAIHTGFISKGKTVTLTISFPSVHTHCDPP